MGLQKRECSTIEVPVALHVPNASGACRVPALLYQSQVDDWCKRCLVGCNSLLHALSAIRPTSMATGALWL